MAAGIGRLGGRHAGSSSTSSLLARRRFHNGARIGVVPVWASPTVRVSVNEQLGALHPVRMMARHRRGPIRLPESVGVRLWAGRRERSGVADAPGSRTRSPWGRRRVGFACRGGEPRARWRWPSSARAPASRPSSLVAGQRRAHASAAQRRRPRPGDRAVRGHRRLHAVAPARQRRSACSWPAIGVSFSLTTLMALRAPLPFTLGRVALAFLIVFTAYVFVCFPRDRLGRRRRARVHSRGRAGERGRVGADARAGAAAPGGRAGRPVRGRVPAQRTADRRRSARASRTHWPRRQCDRPSLILVGVAVALVGKARSPNRLRRGRREAAAVDHDRDGRRVCGVHRRSTCSASPAPSVPAAIVVVGFLVDARGPAGRHRPWADLRRDPARTARGRRRRTVRSRHRRSSASSRAPSATRTLRLLLWSSDGSGYVDV